MADAKRDFVRETIFLCTTFLSAMLSITACDSWNVLAAAALSPAAIALRTFLTAVRSSDFWLALRWRVISAWRARFLAWAELAMTSVPWINRGQPVIITCFRCLHNNLAP